MLSIRTRTGMTPGTWLRLGLLFVLAAVTAPISTGSETVSTPSEGAAAAASVSSSIYAPNLAVITIEGPITAVTSSSFQRRMALALDQGADAIVVELDTPGGEVGACLEICGEIKGSPKPTIAWVNPNAYSAGAIIALACNEIVIATNASMGDAAGILAGPFGAQSVDSLDDETLKAKMMAPMIAEIVDSARLNGYDEILVQGFMTLGVETWQVQNTRTGEMFFLTETEYGQLFGDEPDRGTSMVPSGEMAPPVPSTPPVANDAPTDPLGDEVPVAPETDFISGSERLSSDVTKSVSDGLVSRTRRPNFAQENPADYQVIGYATDGQTLLTLKADLLEAFGFTASPNPIDTDAELMAHVGAQNLGRLDQSWSENVVEFMTQGTSGLVVRGVLIVIFLLSMFLELSMPGIGVAGGVALLALAGLIVPPMLLGAATWWALAAILLGIGLILLEVFVVPGFGVPGILGLMSLLAGLVGTFAGAGQLFPGSGGGGSDLAWAVSTVLLAVFAAVVGMFFVTKYTRSIPIANRLVMGEAQRAWAPEEQRASTLEAMAAATTDGPVRPGDIGTSVTPLRPSGTADFEGTLVDVVAEYGFVDAGAQVRVVNVNGNRVGVEDAGTGADA
jgi:membrane-bound serine protease (ClpP class)